MPTGFAFVGVAASFTAGFLSRIALFDRCRKGSTGSAVRLLQYEEQQQGDAVVRKRVRGRATTEAPGARFRTMHLQGPHLIVKRVHLLGLSNIHPSAA